MAQPPVRRSKRPRSTTPEGAASVQMISGTDDMPSSVLTPAAADQPSEVAIGDGVVATPGSVRSERHSYSREGHLRHSSSPQIRERHSSFFRGVWRKNLVFSLGCCHL